VKRGHCSFYLCLALGLFCASIFAQSPMNGFDPSAIGAVKVDGSSGRPEGMSEEEWAQILARLPDGSDALMASEGVRAVTQSAKLTNPSGGAGDFLGCSVAVSKEGEWAVVGAYHATVGVKANHGNALLFHRNTDNATWSLFKTLLPSDGDAEWLFGKSVAISGDIIAVGSPGAFYNYVGRVYIYYRNQGGADNWGQVRNLLPSDWGMNDNLGQSVALDGDILVAGAPLDDVGSNADQGSAVIFSRNWGGADNWGMVKRIVTDKDPAAGDQFGTSVSVEGGIVVAGAPYHEGKGAAFLFYRNLNGADQWGQWGERGNPDATASGRFGSSVSLACDYLLVGAPGSDSNRGAAYVFGRNEYNADQWWLTKKLTASDGAANDEFGNSVALTDGVALVGAYFDNIGGADRRGSAYLFSQNQGGANNWGQIRKLTASDGAAHDWFGVAVALQTGTILVGAMLDDIGAIANQGSAYIFRYDAGWAPRNTLTAYDAGNYDWKCFGEEVAISGGIAAVRAATSLYNNSDETYIFYRNQGGSHAWQFVKKLTVPPGWGFLYDDNQYDLDLDGDVLVIGCPFEDSDNGAVYIFSRNQGGADNWGQVKRIVGTGLGDVYTEFGWSVALDNSTLVVGAPEVHDGSQWYPTGGAAIFHRNQGGPDNWGKVAQFYGAIQLQRAGEAVDISGDTVVMGAPVWDNQTSAYQTRAYVHRRNLGGPDAWGREQTLVGPENPNGSRQFGFSVAVFDDIAAVGCPQCEFPLFYQGAVMIYRRNAGGPSAWGQVATLLGNNPIQYGYLGYDLAMEGDRIVVGGHGRDMVNGGYNLRTLVFSRHFGGADNWGQEAVLTTAAGNTVAISDRTILTAYDFANEDDGAAYLFYNHAPLAAADSYSTSEGVELTVSSPGLMTNDSDQNSDAISASKDTDPAHGAVTLNADGSFTYTPTPGYCGPDGFTYHLGDGITTSDTATVSITVTTGMPTNEAVTDNSACAAGLTVTFTAGSCATRHDLVRDGSVVVTGITSGAAYTPGDSVSHTYRVRAVGTNGSTDSDEVTATDLNDIPGAPSITDITDVSPCAASGIQVAYSAGSGATSHNLLMGSVIVVTGYASGATYVPGDTASHAYIVQAVKGTCTANSPPSSGTDASGTPGAPSITSIADESPCAQSGVRINYSAGSGAASHNLVRNGSVVVTGYASGALYNPGNAFGYTYIIRAVNGACTADSAGRTGLDANDQPGAPTITGITDDNANAQSGIHIGYTAGSGAGIHSLLRDGAVAVTGYPSGSLYNPGDSASHSYKIRAVNGACAAESGTSDFSDAASTADLALAIADSPDPVCQNATLIAGFTASNNGAGNAGQVYVTGTLPSSLSLGLTDYSDDDGTGFGAGTHAGTLWDGANLTVDPVWTSQWELPDNQANAWIDMAGNVALFHMNEPSGTLADASGSGHTATLSGGVIQGAGGVLGAAVTFGGVDGGASADTGIDLANRSFSISFWARRMSSGREDYFIHQGVNSPNMGLYVGFRSTNVFTFAFFGNDLNTPAAYTDREWHLWTCTYESGTRERIIYRDGRQVAQGTASAHYQGLGVFYVGRSLLGWALGTLDEVAVWTRELSAAEVQAIYDRQASHFSASFTSRIMDAGVNRTWTTLEWAPQSPYGKELPGGGQSESGYPAGNANMTSNTLLMHLNEVSGGLADTSGGGHTGTANGGVLYGAEGRFRTALSFDGTNDYVYVPYAQNPTVYTIEAWVNPDSTSSRNLIVRTSSSGPTVHRSHQLFIDGSGRFVHYLYDGAQKTVTGTTVVTPGRWYHVVGTAQNGGAMQLYVNGAAEGGTAAVGTMWTGGDRFLLGSNASGSGFFSGRMDEVAIYHRILSPTEIASRYARGAARLKFQVRTCYDAACSGETFTGPNGTASEYYSELDNEITTPPVQAVRRQANNRYFQYKAVLEFDAAAPLSQLASVTVRHAPLGTFTTTGTCGLAGLTMLCDLGTIANAANASAAVTGTATALGSITSSGTVSSGSIDPAPGNNGDSEGTAVVDCTPAPPVNNMGTNAARYSKNPDANTLLVTYDSSLCSAAKAILMYGTIGTWTGYQGAADCDLGNAGSDPAVNATGLDNVWFNIVWTNGTAAGHPGYGFNGTAPVARTWTVGTVCSMSGDNHSHMTCP